MVHIFGKYFFPHIIKGDYETPDIHLDLLHVLSSPQSNAAIIPRGHAKSTWEKIDTLHDIVYDLEEVILYLGSSKQDAQFHFEGIKDELEGNEKLRYVYGNLVPEHKKDQSAKWTNSHFETTNGVNCIARGAGKGRGVNVKNRRPTKVILDDGETDEQVRSKHRREKFAKWVYEVLIPSLDKEKGRLKFVGTVIHPHAEVLKFYKAYGGIFRKAIENGKSAWPEYWTLEDLKALRDGYIDEEGKQVPGIGLRAFSQEYMNTPINSENTVFKAEWLENNTYEKMPTKEEMKQYFDIVMAIDPNAGESEMADYMGVCVLGKDRRTNKRWVLYADHFKLPIKAEAGKKSQVSVINEIFEEFQPSLVGVEKIMNQTALYQILVAERKFPVKALTPEGKDKVNRARHFEHYVAQGLVLFNPAHTVLYEEMVEFPLGEHDDLCDAFIYANSMIMESALKLSQKKSQMNTSGLIKKKF